MHEHVKHLRKHRNILYGISGFLLLVQIGFFIFFFIYVTTLTAEVRQFQQSISGDIDSLRENQKITVDELTREIGQQRQDVAQAFASQEANFSREIDFLRASQEDFAGVVEQSVNGVVTISTDRAAGSGFFVRPDGYVVTNHHVIDGAHTIHIQTSTGAVLNAQLVADDSNLDLALLKVNGSFMALTLGNSDDVLVGQRVVAIGNPLGLSFTVTQGIISALHRVGQNGLPAYIQTDVTLNPGNSGGPLITSSGEVVGMNNFKIGDAEGLGFALESNTIATRVAEFLNETG